MDALGELELAFRDGNIDRKQGCVFSDQDLIRRSHCYRETQCREFDKRNRRG